MNKKSGFTLAEVLVTLMIIGVVATMTVPTLMNASKSQEYIAGAKKAHAVLNQAAATYYAIHEEDANQHISEMMQETLGIGSGGRTEDGITYTWSGPTVTVDVNGTKGPNQEGSADNIQDKFQFTIRERNATPTGAAAVQAITVGKEKTKK